MKKLVFLNDNLYALVDTDTNEIENINLSDLEEEKKILVNTTPEDLTGDDEKLLAWAKGNYSISNDVLIREKNIKRIAEINEILALKEN